MARLRRGDNRELTNRIGKAQSEVRSLSPGRNPVQGSPMSGGDCPSLSGHCSNYTGSSDCNNDPCCCWSGSNHSCNGCGDPQGPCGINGTWNEWYATNTGTWVESHCKEYACDQKAGCKDPNAVNYCPDCVFCCEVGYDQSWANEVNCCCYDPESTVWPCGQQQQTAPPGRSTRKGGPIRKRRHSGTRSLSPGRNTGHNLMHTDLPDCCYAGVSGYGTWRCTGIYGHGGGSAIDCQVSESCSACGQLPSDAHTLCNTNNYCEPEGIDQSCGPASDWNDICTPYEEPGVDPKFFDHQASAPPTRERRGGPIRKRRHGGSFGSQLESMWGRPNLNSQVQSDRTNLNSQHKIYKANQHNAMKGKRDWDNMIGEYHSNECCYPPNPGNCGGASYLVNINCGGGTTVPGGEGNWGQEWFDDSADGYYEYFWYGIDQFSPTCGSCSIPGYDQMLHSCGLQDPHQGYNPQQCGDTRWCPCLCTAADIPAGEPGSCENLSPEMGWDQETTTPGREGKRGGWIV